MPIDAVLDLQREHGFEVIDIESIAVKIVEAVISTVTSPQEEKA